MTNGYYDRVINEFPMKDSDIDQLAPLVLAYVGDTVYEVFIRTYLVSCGKASVHALHKRSIQYVKAKSQSDIIHRLTSMLTPEELDVVRRGRNAKSGSIPKNADVTEYKYATGFEALIGYLYLKGRQERLVEILRLAVYPDEGRADNAKLNNGQSDDSQSDNSIVT